MFSFFLKFIPGLFSIGGKLIEDKDKRNEFAFKALELTYTIMLKMLETKTYPWVDGLVKLAYASEHIIKGLFRPIGAALMFAFGIYAELNTLELSEPIQYMLFGALPAWGVDRGLNKRKKQEPDDDEDWQMGLALTEASLTAANTFCTSVIIKGDFNVSVSGTWAGTVTVQRSFDNSTWVDVEAFTANFERIGLEPETTVYYRVGFKTAEYTSGTATVRISR